MRIIDRYVIRQVLVPFCLGLAVFTFLLIIPTLRDYLENFVTKGVPTLIVLRAMATLIPQSLALTIPMSLLLGLLIGFGRLSADREFVAMQACGVSLTRLLRPVAVVSVAAWLATSYVWLVLLPAGNQAFRDIAFNVVTSSAEGDVQPRVFFTEFPNLTLYVREIPPSGGGWNGVFMADTQSASAPVIYLAEHGRVAIDRTRKTVTMVLDHAVRHTVDAAGKYQVGRFEHIVLSVDPARVFPQGGPVKGDNEMTIGELRDRIAENENAHLSTANQELAIQRKFSIPVACLVFGLIGLALGATNRRDGTLGSFVLGLVVIFAYYIPLYIGPGLANAGLMPPWLAAWAPNLILGALGGALFVWRNRVADRPIRIPTPAFLSRLRAGGGRTRRAGIGLRIPGLRLVDRYVAGLYLRIMVLAGVAMAGIFYISTFIALSDKVFRGKATWAMLGSYLWYATPQYIYYLIPLSVLLAALVTVSVLTKNSELTVMKACGISLYRFALPMIAVAVVAGGGLFMLDQSVLGPANRRAESIRWVMKGQIGEGPDAFSRQWAMSPDGRVIYHYNYFDAAKRQLLLLDVYRFDAGFHRIVERTSAQRAVNVDAPGGQAVWRLDQGWTRAFDDTGEPKDFAAFASTDRPLETPAYFGTEAPDARFMSYTQLRDYTAHLQESGLNVLEQQVALARKVSFPFITLIMTLIAVPFAVTIGRSGAMAGIGIGIGLAIVYWTTLSLFAALGAGGMLTPLLSAWAPNLLFGAGAAYLLLTVKT